VIEEIGDGLDTEARERFRMSFVETNVL